jgi:hypothetical protein
MVAQPLCELPEPRKMDKRILPVRKKNKMASVVTLSLSQHQNDYDDFINV